VTTLDWRAYRKGEKGKLRPLSTSTWPSKTRTYSHGPEEMAEPGQQHAAAGIDGLAVQCARTDVRNNSFTVRTVEQPQSRDTARVLQKDTQGRKNKQLEYEENTGGKPAEQLQRDERLLDGSPLHLEMCPLYLYLGSSTRDIMYP
jgi:hypothetical protein